VVVVVVQNSVIYCDRQTREEGPRVVRHCLSLGGWEVRLGIQAEENGLRSTICMPCSL